MNPFKILFQLVGWLILGWVVIMALSCTGVVICKMQGGHGCG